MGGLVFMLGQSSGKPVAVRVPCSTNPVDFWPSRIGQTQQSGHLVEGFACGVVDGVAQADNVVNDVVDEQKRRMAPGYQERNRWSLQAPPLRAQQLHSDVADQVIDRVERHVETRSQAFCPADANHQSTDQPRTGGDRYGVNVFGANSGDPHRIIHYLGQRLQVGPRRHLWHHPTKTLVLGHRRRNHVGQQCVPPDNPHTGFITARLNANNERILGGHCFPPFGSSWVWSRMTIASTLPG